MFRAATVKSREAYSRATGRRMAEGLVSRLGCKPDVCWLFCSPQNGLTDLLAGIQDVVNTCCLAGCTTAGEISSDGFSSGSAVLAGVATDQIDFHLSVAEQLGNDSEIAGENLARGLPKSTTYIQLFSDGLTGNGSGILRGIAAVLGENLPVCGGTAGDDGKFRKTWQFAGKEILTDAAVAIGFSGDFKVGTGVHSGWTPVGLAKKVTRSSGNVLYELDGEPALKVFERFLGKHAHKLPEIGVEYPLGLAGKWGSVGRDDYSLLRATMSINREQGSIRFAGEIPEGALVNLTCSDKISILRAAGEATQLALTDLGDTKAAILFCYSCTARKVVLGPHIREEVELLREAVGHELPMAGFYSYGEYSPAKSKGPNFLHNETIAISVIGF